MTCVSTRHVYYDIGRGLTSDLLGKKVLMTEPYRKDDGLDYTFMPSSLDNAFTLEWLTDSSAVVSRGNVYYHVCKEALSKWMTIDEFRSCIHKTQGFIHFIHYGMPC